MILLYVRIKTRSITRLIPTPGRSTLQLILCLASSSFGPIPLKLEANKLSTLVVEVVESL